ncbi:flagellar motor protein MotB [Pseudodonghicola xiamenensis]|uniref:Membrane protein n=1 Tax=Pseudodonghicola xiamenensis TaxID=337702 RepID=A0A8J3H4T1_9RHOB|nr:flagellar motor protein MotB [Pseudodonghicola xiamenensis]GHG85547.1 membrane protein [Pseudodonghicola xiamenensis]
MAAKTGISIIRRVEVTEEGGHHGGAWKVAYADFMTAMMAFFLLLWILSSSDEQKLRGIAEYFTNATMPNGSGLLDGATFGPPGTLNASSGMVVARGAEMGEIDDPSPARWEVMDVTQTANPDDLIKGTYKGAFDNPATGALSDHDNPAGITDREGQAEGDNSHETAGAPHDTEGRSDRPTEGRQMASQTAAQNMAQAMRATDTAQFNTVESDLRQAIQANPDLRPLAKSVMFEKTPDGLRIQVVDQIGKPMFASGSANMSPATLKLMEKLGQSLAGLPNDMVISGHTDAVPFTKRQAYDNWDLSSDRANALRRVLVQTGVDASRITRVSGMADTDPLVPADPFDPSNRRISILLEYRKLPDAGLTPAAQGEPGASLQPQDSTPAAGPLPAPQPSMAQDSRRAEAPIAPQPQRVSELNEEVFENLRTALR